MSNIETSFNKLSGVAPSVTNDLNSLVTEAQSLATEANSKLTQANATLTTVNQKAIDLDAKANQITANAAKAISDTTTAITTLTSSSITNIMDTANTSAQTAANTAKGGVQSVADNAISTVTSTRDSAVATINTTKDSAIQSVSNSSSQVIAATNDGISKVNAARDAGITAVNNTRTSVVNDVLQAKTDSAASATAAATSATNANTFRGNASTFATNASNSATAANTSATNASNSATAAAGSATTASTKAGEASTSATNASNSATAAATSASNAADSATAAANSAASITPSTLARNNTANTFSQAQTISASSATPLTLTRSGVSNISLVFNSTGTGGYTKYLGTNSSGELRISDNADLTANASSLPLVVPTGSYTFTQAQSFASATRIKNNSGEAEFKLDAVPGQGAFVRYMKGDSSRWVLGAHNDAESGSNAGSNFVLNRYADDGSYINQPLTISRADGTINVNNALAVGGNGITTNTLTASGLLQASTLQVAANAYFSMSSSNPLLNFDTQDYLQFMRSSNQLNVVIGNTARLSVNPTQVTATVPVILPTTQSTSGGAAVHKTYVDSTFMPKTGGAFSGAISAPSFSPGANASFSLDGNSNPVLTFDPNDAIIYDRTNNSINLLVNGVGRMYVNTLGAQVIGTLALDVGNFYKTATEYNREYAAGWRDVWNVTNGARTWTQPGLNQMWLDSGGHLGTAGNITAGGVVTANGGAGLSVNGSVPSGGNYVTTVLSFNPNWEPMYYQGVHIPNQYAATRIVVGSSAAKAWDFRNDGNATAHGTWIDGSDGRVKADRVKLASPLDKVDQLTGYTFTRTDMNDKRDIGLIAQDVKAVLPEAVHVAYEPFQGGEGFHSVNYNGVTALLVEAMKELRAEVAVLKAQLGQA